MKIENLEKVELLSRHLKRLEKYRGLICSGSKMVRDVKWEMFYTTTPFEMFKRLKSDIVSALDEDIKEVIKEIEKL